MTQFAQPRFSVKTGERDPKVCGHDANRPWVDGKGRCVQCGETLAGPRDTRFDAPSGKITTVRNGVTMTTQWDTWAGR